MTSCKVIPWIKVDYILVVASVSFYGFHKSNGFMFCQSLWNVHDFLPPVALYTITAYLTPNNNASEFCEECTIVLSLSYSIPCRKATLLFVGSKLNVLFKAPSISSVNARSRMASCCLFIFSPTFHQFCLIHSIADSSFSCRIGEITATFD
jgi:hypothetical protein